MPAQPVLGLDAFAGDADGDALTAEPSAQVGPVVGFVGVDFPRRVVPAAFGVVSRMETGQQGLQALAVGDVAT